jgi:serine/threonine protein kinase
VKWLSDGTLAHLREVADLPDFSGTPYRVVRELGRGGMGTVYLAEDTRLGREVAVKVLSAPDPDAARRMLQEARIVAGLEHPGIVPVHDAGVLPDGRVFYAMKRVRGSPLESHDERSVPALLRIFEKVCEAVAFAHAHGVIHRDLKPANVMVGEFGEVLVMDWGVARLTAPAAASEEEGEPPRSPTALFPAAHVATQAGSVIGTRGYMAPEQARGQTADERSDVFALGGILAFLLTRRHPPAAADDAPFAESDGRTRVPPALASVCRKAMADLPADRYATARELAAEAARYLQGEPLTAHREGFFERARRVAYRHRAWILLVLAYLVMRTLLLFFGR